MENAANFFAGSKNPTTLEDRIAAALPKSPAQQALENIKAHLPDNIKIEVPESDFGDVRIASFIGEHYMSSFPFLAACRGATLHSECSVYSKKGYYNSLKRTADILQSLGAIEVTLAEEEKNRIHFILRNSTLLEYCWVTGFIARNFGKYFRGMPFQYVLHPNIISNTVSISLTAFALVGKTLFAMRLVVSPPNDMFFKRIQDLSDVLELPKSKVILLVVPQPKWRYTIERFRNCGYTSCELSSIGDVLQRLRREEQRRHAKEQQDE